MRLGFGIDEFIAGLEILDPVIADLKKLGIFYGLHKRRLLLHPIDMPRRQNKFIGIRTNPYQVLADGGIFSEGVLAGFFVVRL